MSSIYVPEPPTSGKVILVTTVGEIEIELWCKETPLACRNFIQLCMEGYYNGCIFHRVIPEFMAQTGDPTGTGTGGQSIWGEPFKDEFHSRLSFNRRGLVGMANPGKKDSNGSQFFITLDRCEWLNRKHTLFGKVNATQIVGNTIYNVLRMQEIEIGNDDRPTDPPYIKKGEAVTNPFSDIVPRDLTPQTGKRKEDPVEQRRRKKARKEYNLLSFGEEAEEEDEENLSKERIKPAHEKLHDDNRLTQESALTESDLKDREANDAGFAIKEQESRGEQHEREEAFENRDDKEKVAESAHVTGEYEATEGTSTRSTNKSSDSAKPSQSKEQKRQLQEEKRAQRLRRMGVAKAVGGGEHQGLDNPAFAQKTAKARKKKVAEHEGEMLKKLERFEEKLREYEGKRGDDTGNEEGPSKPEEEQREGGVGITRYVPEGLYYMHEEDDDEDWKSHSFTFKGKEDPMAHHSAVEDYVVDDPLNSSRR